MKHFLVQLFTFIAVFGVTQIVLRSFGAGQATMVAASFTVGCALGEQFGAADERRKKEGGAE